MSEDKIVKAGLVLEGGGMKGFYTLGVLDFFMDQGLYFENVYGVSAGACHMTSYLSKQRGRGFDICSDYLDTKEYMGARSLFTTGDVFNVQFAYYLVPDVLNPFDYDAYERYPGKAYAVVTNIETGEPEYPQIKDVHKDMPWVQASASLPMVSRNVKIGGGKYLDGGISDAIPLKKSIEDGNAKNVVIMTKEEGYVRKPLGNAALAAVRTRYLKYPQVFKLMRNRDIRYNNQVEYIEQQVAAGNALLIRPKEKSDVKRIDRNVEHLKKLYDTGYQDAQSRYTDIMKYLNS